MAYNGGMTNLTDEQWRLYEEKYGRLMHTISMKISGDEMLASHEDNYADLTIAAMDSIRGYLTKESLTFEEAFDTKGFDKYTKTVLWNRKNKKGVKLTSRMEFRNKHKSLSPFDDDSKAYEVEDLSATPDYSMSSLQELFDDSDEDVKKVVNAVVSDPSVVTEDGKLKGYSLCKPTGLSIHYIRKAVDKIKNTLEIEYGL